MTVIKVLPMTHIMHALALSLQHAEALVLAESRHTIVCHVAKYSQYGHVTDKCIYTGTKKMPFHASVTR